MFGDELRQGVEPRFDLAPVVVCFAQYSASFSHRRELHALRGIRHQLLAAASLVAAIRRFRSARASSGGM